MSEETQVSEKLAKIIDEVKGLSVMELADLVHALEDEFGVSAQAVAVAGPDQLAVLVLTLLLKNQLSSTSSWLALATRRSK